MPTYYDHPTGRFTIFRRSTHPNYIKLVEEKDIFRGRLNFKMVGRVELARYVCLLHVSLGTGAAAPPGELRVYFCGSLTRNSLHCLRIAGKNKAREILM